VIREVAEVYEDAGARGLYELVLRQRQDVDDLLRGHHGPAHRAELLVVAGRLTVLLCHLSFDLSSETLADAYSAEAWTIGDLCGDHGLQAYARSAQSFMAYYRGDYQDAAAYAADAARYAGSRPEAVQAAIHQARAHARLGDRETVDRAVGRAFELRSSLNEPDAPHPFLAFEPYDTARIAGNAATAYLSLGATDRVVEYTDSALPALAACGSRAGQALTRLDAASAHLIGDAPDPERAADEVAQAVAAAGGLRSTVIARRAREFVHTAERWQPTPAVGAATEQVRDWMSPHTVVEEPEL
jgi:tetratricopeptide (TPR) repeat protein